MYRTPFRDDQQLVREPPTLVSVDRGNGSLVGVTQRGARGPLIGFACPAATARPSDRAYDETQRRADEISITFPVQRHGEIVQETYLLNPAPEDLACSDLASVGDVEFATPIYVAQHLAVIGMLVGPEVQHVELIFGCPFSCWGDEALKSELREALRGLHRFTLNGVSRSIYLTPYLLPQPIMAAANLIVPGGVPNPALADTLVGIIDIGTGTDDYALVRGFRTESGRAGGDSGTRGLAWACEELWKRLKHDERFPLLRREPFPGAHAMLPVLDTSRFRYGGELVHVATHVDGVLRDLAERTIRDRFSDHVWGKRWREIAVIGGASGGTARLWPYLTAGVRDEWRPKLQLIEPAIQALHPDPLGRGTAVYAVAAGGYYAMLARKAMQRVAVPSRGGVVQTKGEA